MIMIVGGAGYIGSHVNKVLHGKGYETLVVDNLSRGHRELVKWGEFVQGDIGDAAFLRRVFDDYHVDAVMHFAAFAYVGESVADPGKYYQNNVSNTLTLLNVMKEKGVGRFIFSSTCSTYGVPSQIPITEEHSQCPINPYGESKLMVERILRDFGVAYGLKSISLRYFNAAGADIDAEIGEWHEPETHLIPLVLDAAMGRREDISIFGTDYKTPDGTCIRDYVHVTDLADAHVLALEYLSAGGDSNAFNLGNGSGFSVREVIDVARKVSGRNIKAAECPRRAGDPPVLVGSAEKAQKCLKWTPVYGKLESIIETAWIWHKQFNRRYNY
ncbi:MAG: UDP-glucose 4-epimerase GalE [Nitrospirae bacterium]|nr:UDP-glucose 4-epimerase GalE [Nitrospirota bacterium]